MANATTVNTAGPAHANLSPFSSLPLTVFSPLGPLPIVTQIDFYRPDTYDCPS
jgi:hypothetical protein